MSEEEKKTEEQPEVELPEPDLTPPEAQPLATIKISSDPVDSMHQLVTLSDSIFHEPTCAICNDPHREEIEKKYHESNSYKSAKDLANSKGDIDVTEGEVKNHMLYHYERDIRPHQMREYIDKLDRLNTTKTSTLQSIQMGLSALLERLAGVNSIVPDQNTSEVEIEKIKSQETNKIMSSYCKLLQLQANMLGEMKNNGELISIPKDSFIGVFNNAIVNAKTEAEKELIKDILHQLGSLGKT